MNEPKTAEEFADRAVEGVFIEGLVDNLFRQAMLQAWKDGCECSRVVSRLSATPHTNPVKMVEEIEKRISFERDSKQLTDF